MAIVAAITSELYFSFAIIKIHGILNTTQLLIYLNGEMNDGLQTKHKLAPKT